MLNHDINSKEDISHLVNVFYARVREDQLLGPIFNSIVKDWDEHLERIAVFWESNLFLNKKYFGNPLEAHVAVDSKVDHSITQEHFGTWINLWIKTIDELYQGETADKAKFRARKMSTFLYMKIFEARP